MFHVPPRVPQYLKNIIRGIRNVLVMARCSYGKIKKLCRRDPHRHLVFMDGLSFSLPKGWLRIHQPWMRRKDFRDVIKMGLVFVTMWDCIFADETMSRKTSKKAAKPPDNSVTYTSKNFKNVLGNSRWNMKHTKQK